MFDLKCAKELFRPQKVLSMHSLRTVFSKLAHSSIMKLNETAMDKVMARFLVCALFRIIRAFSSAI